MSMLVGASVGSLLIGNSNVPATATTYQEATSAHVANASTVPASTTSEIVTKEAPAPKEKFKAVTVAKSTSSIDLWLQKLVMKESNGRTRIKVMDVNGKYSYGCLQFQMATFQAYMRRFSLLSEMNLGGWEETIYDCELQKRLAKLMLEEDYDAWMHWYNSTLAIGYPPQF